MLKNDFRIKLLASETKYKTAYNNYSNVSFFLFGIQTNECFPNLNDELCLPSTLYSYKLKSFIKNESSMPFIDFSNVEVSEEGKSLEDLIGIQQKLSPELALELVTGTKPNLTRDSVVELDLVNILLDAQLVEGETCFLPNENYAWKPTKELFISDEGFEKNVDSSNKLHSDFKSLKDVFEIQELSKNNLIIKTEGENKTREVDTFFNERAKYLACKLNNGYKNIEELANKIIEKIKDHSFYECSQIKYVFPENNPIYEKSIDFIGQEDVIKFTGYWKNNEKVRQFLYNQIDDEQLPRTWFDNLISRWEEKEIIAKLEDDFGPSLWGSPNNEEQETQRDFIKEVEDYIDNHLKEVEDIYDDDKITELKNMLQNFSNHEKGKQEAFNMLAKLKLCKKEGLLFKKDWKRNEVEEGEVKYFIHSARGAFAYIHPNEILRMQDEGFKMAIDYGRLDIRIYEKAEEIISLYENYLMLYQKPEDIDDVIKICEESKSRSKFHFLIVDSEKQTDDVQAILKLMNVQNYE